MDIQQSPPLSSGLKSHKISCYTNNVNSKECVLKNTKNLADSKLYLDTLNKQDISNYIDESFEKEQKIFKNFSTEPRTSQLWSTMILRNLLIGPIAEMIAIKDGDHLAIADLATSLLFTTVADTKALVKRYKDIKINEYEEEELSPLKHDIKNPLNFVKECASRTWQKYGLPEQAMATSIPIFLFDAFVLGNNIFNK